MTTPRYWRITAPHKILLLLIVVIVLAGRANAQPIRFDQTASTTSASCASGKQCPVLVLPGTQINFCTTAGFSTLAACLANPLATYTNSGGGTPCPSTAQLTPAIGGACLSTADNQGAFGVWFQPQTAYYYLRVPATAGGGTYGPYPFSFGVDGQASGVTYNEGGTGAVTRTVASKLQESVSVLDFGADPTNTLNSTTAFVNAVAVANATGACTYVPRGIYKVLNASGVASIVLSSTSTTQGCIRGDGPGQSIILQGTNNGVTIGVQGGWPIIRDLFLAQEPGVSGSRPISIYPDVTANGTYSEASEARMENLQIDYAYCGNIGFDATPTPNCAKPASPANYLTTGILIQSGAKDSLFHAISHVNINHTVDGIRFMSGGLAGSASGGAVEGVAITDVKISNSTDACVRFTSSLRNTVRGLQCDFSADIYKFDTQASGFYAGLASSSNDIDAIPGEGLTNYVDWGSQSIGNHVHILGNMALNGFTTIGSAQSLNYFDTQDNYQVGFHLTGPGEGFMSVGQIANPSNPASATFQVNETPNVKETVRVASTGAPYSATLDYLHLNPYGSSLGSGTYTSGATVTGTAGQVCLLTFASGSPAGLATISLTGTNTIAGGTAFIIVNGGLFSAAPTSATLSVGATPSPAASCSGTVVVATLLTAPGHTERTPSTYTYGTPWHNVICGNTNSFSGTRYCEGYGLLTPIGNANGDWAQLSGYRAGIVNGDARSYAALTVNNSAGTEIVPGQFQGDGLPVGTIKANLGGGFGCSHGSNATCGVATLSSGTVVVPTSAIGAGGVGGSSGVAISLTPQTCSSCGALSVGTVVNNTSFAINSTNGSDGSKVYWRIDYIY